MKGILGASSTWKGMEDELNEGNLSEVNESAFACSLAHPSEIASSSINVLIFIPTPLAHFFHPVCLFPSLSSRYRLWPPHPLLI